MRNLSIVDKIIVQVDGALNSIFATQSSSRSNPAGDTAEISLSDNERSKSRGCMRVNHTGEVCAQALYRGQLVFAKDEQTRDMLKHAAVEETDHLAWTHKRLQELGTHRSYLNSFWYFNSFMMGMLAAKFGDQWSLGFVEETERQVTQHLESHLDVLSPDDLRSRKIVEQMKIDEEQHGASAKAVGAAPLPATVKALMKLHAKVMTTTARWC